MNSTFFILALVMCALNFGFTQPKEYSQKVILWPSANEGDPEFKLRIHSELKKSMLEHPHYSFLKTDSIKLIAEIHNFNWPIGNQLLRDSLASIMKVRWQFEFETGSYTQAVYRNVFFVMAEERQTYSAVLKISDQGASVFEGRTQSDSIIELGWCGLIDCHSDKRPAHENLKIKEKLLKKSIDNLMIDAYRVLRRKE